MVDPLARTSAFQGLLADAGPAPAGVTVAEWEGPAVALIQAREGQADAFAARVAQSHGVPPPRGPRRASGAALTLLGVGRGRWLAFAPDIEALEAEWRGLASVIDQSDGLAILRVRGVRSRDVFAKGLPIDLDPAAFPEDAVAVSIIAHVGVTIWRDGDAFLVAVARSLTRDLWHWLSDSAAEFGLRAG